MKYLSSSYETTWLKFDAISVYNFFGSRNANPWRKLWVCYILSEKIPFTETYNIGILCNWIMCNEIQVDTIESNVWKRPKNTKLKRTNGKVYLPCWKPEDDSALVHRIIAFSLLVEVMVPQNCLPSSAITLKRINGAQ